MALISAQPWAPSVVAPQLGLAPGIGVALDDALAVDGGEALAVAPARPEADRGSAHLAARATPAPEAVDGPRLGLSEARVVAEPASGGPPQAEAPQPEPVALPAPQPAPPAPVAVPVASPAPAPRQVEEPPAGGASGDRDEQPGLSTAGVDLGGIEEPIEVGEGEEGAFAFSFFILPTAYLALGIENSIARFSGEASETSSFGLQLWDDGGAEGRGLWASGEAMGGERFLAPVEVGVWHELAVYFRASSEGDGFYLVLLDSEPVDARAWISLLDADAERTWIELGPSVEPGSVGGVAVGAIFEPSSAP